MNIRLWLMLGFSVMAAFANAQELQPAPRYEPGSSIQFNPCSNSRTRYSIFKAPLDSLYSPLLVSDMAYFVQILECRDEQYLYLLQGELPVGENYSSAHFGGSDDSGFKVLRTVPVTSSEALFLYAWHSQVFSRGVAAQQPYNPRRDDGDERRDERSFQDAIGGDRYLIYSAPAQSQACSGGRELFLAHLKSSVSILDLPLREGESADDGFDRRTERVVEYQPQPDRALGLCWNMNRRGFPIAQDPLQREVLSALDYRWENDNVLTLLVDGYFEAGEGMVGIEVDVANSTAKKTFEITGNISGIEMFPNGCGQYAVGARLVGQSVAIMYRRPRMVFVNVANPQALTAQIPFILSESGGWTCEGGGPSFEYGRLVGNGRYSDSSIQVIVDEERWGDERRSYIQWRLGDQNVVAFDQLEI